MAGEGIAQALGECSHAFGVGADGDTQSLFSVLPLSLLGWSCPHLPEERFIVLPAVLHLTFVFSGPCSLIRSYRQALGLRDLRGFID